MEMNIFAPESIQAQIELEQIADVKYQIMTPQSSAPIISIKEDALVGSFNMTGNELTLDWRTAMNILSATKMNNYNVIPKDKTIGGKEVYSTIIPKKINMYKGDATKAVISVKNGEIVDGRIVDAAIGAKKKNNLIQLVLDEYGVDEAVVFLDNITRLVNNFNLYHGMTVGIGDLDISYDLYKKMYQVFKTKKLEVNHEITEVENNPDMMDEELFEVTIKQKLDIIRDDIGKLIFNNLKPDNNMKIMNECGSKGSILNIGQMGGCVGNQDFQGDRMPKNYNERTLPYFFKNDDSAEARGFIEGSFLNGLNLSEFIFHHVTGREGLIDQALKSVTPDTTIMIMENLKTKIVKIGDWIDEHLKNGYKNTPNLIETKKTMNFELLNVTDMYIPTVDEDGKVTWGEVTALTKHDSGNCIYEIITQSGRIVKVPESKSLLVWKDDKFVPLLTPEVKVGDKVPVTMKLSVPPEIINEIDMSKYFSKKEYIYGTEFMKAKQEMENVMNGKYRIPAGWWNQNNGTKFTLPYNKKARFQRVLSGRTDVANIKEDYFYSYSTNRDSLIPDKFKLTRENGQFIGLYIADGNVYCAGSGYIQITKSNEAVLNFAEKYFDKLQINHARQSKTTAVGTSIDVRGFSKILAQFMEMIVGSGSANKRIPDFALNAPEEFIIGLLDGYFSGDGSVDRNSIDASSSSEILIDGINMLLTRIGIFAKKAIVKVNANNNFKANYDSYTISIRGQWAKQFKTKIGTLINSDKNIKLISMIPSENHKYYQEIEDVILDSIVSINKLDSKDYPKLYDLTVPSTLNFMLANGLGVRDTASSGYLQRKFIKATEDFMVKYDGTVRNAVERIQQFIYGDSGIDTVKQYDYKFKIMEMNNAEVADKFKFTKEELKNVKNFTEANNEAFYKEILSMRDNLRQSQMKATMNYLALNTNYMLPVNINRIVDNAKNSNNKDPVLNEPEYIIKLIDNILLPNKCRLYSMTEEEMKNEKSPKFIDDKLSKTAFRYALYETLAPKKCINVYKLSKKQLDNISEQIISSFNRSVVEPGEMVGILGAQSLGEPVTQMVLNSVDWKEEILVRDTKTNEDLVIPIGKFIDEQIENEKDKVVSVGDNLENNMKGIYYLDTKSKNYYIQSVNEDGKISWKKIEAITKHLPINKDGSNTLIKVTTRMGKSVIATKGKSFLTQRDNKVVPIRGDEIKVGDYLPIMKNYCNDYAFDELDITGYFPKDEYIYGSEIAKAKALRNKNLAEGNREWFKRYIGKDFTVPYARQDSLKNVIDKNFDYRVNCIYPKQSHVDTHIPEKIKLDNDFGFLIGAYLAEGCITKTQICISNNNKAYRDRIAKLCDRYNVGHHEVRRDKETNKLATQDTYEIRIHSMMLVEVIENICSKYSYGKYVPSFAFNSNLEFIKGLLDGYISGDGTVRHVGRAKYISMTSVSKKLLVGISTLLTKFGIVSKLSTNKLQESNNLNSKVIHQSYSLMIRNNNILKFGKNIELTESNKNNLVKDICKTEFKFDNGYYDIYPSVKLESDKNTNFRRDKLVDLLDTDITDNDERTINTIINNDVFFDEIMSIEEVKPSNTYVYDFTIEETQNFIMADGLCMRDSFHNTGIGGLGGANLGVPRMQEVFSLSKNMKAPFMMVYLDKEHREKKDFANKIASYIKFTTIQDLRTNIEIYYDPKPYDKGGFMEKDNVYNIFYAFQQSKSCCLNKVDGLPWLMRIEFDKEKLMNKEVSLLDIKSRFCVEWEKRFQDVKSMKREKRQILEKITQLAVLTNTDNDSVPTMHIRFDMTNFNSSTLIDFMDMFVDEFKLKGMPDIEDIAGGSATEERIISFDGGDGVFEKNKNEYIIYTKGINMTAIRDIIGVDLTRTYCNDIITTYEMFGIEAARNLIIREVTAVFAANGSAVNHQHVSIFGDLMTNVGSLTSIDRHGLNKLDTDPLARASFEKTVEQLITAAVFNEVDHMNSVSSRIMAGLCIKGGTGLCNLVLDRELLENSEYTIDIGQLYKKTYDDIIPTQAKQEIDADVFIPDF